MAARQPARASPELRKAPLSPRYPRNYTTPQGTTYFSVMSKPAQIAGLGQDDPALARSVRRGGFLRHRSLRPARQRMATRGPGGLCDLRAELRAPCAEAWSRPKARCRISRCRTRIRSTGSATTSSCAAVRPMRVARENP